MGSIARRHKYILEQLNINGYVKVQDLSTELDVSEVTIRKDLKLLESKKLLHRSHGSASSLSSITTEEHVDVKAKMHMDEKLRIAKAANKLIEANDKVIIASGTTLFTFACNINISTNQNITVISSSVKVSLTLCYNPNIEIIQLGGTMRKNAVSVIGHYAENILEGMTCNKLFIGVDGLDLDYGLTTSNMGEARLNQEMIAAAQEIIVLTDSSKFGKRGFSKICDLSSVHKIITDKNAPAHIIEKMREKEIEVILV